MDTEAFLLRRESLSAAMEAERAQALAEKPEPKNFLWLGLPLIPLAGFFAAKKIDGHKHPMVKGFVNTGLRKLVLRLLGRWGLQQLTQPSTIKRILSFV